MWRDAFDVEIGELRPMAGGFEADALTDGHWLVKVWRYEPPHQLHVFADLAAAGLPVPVPLQTVDGTWTATWDDGRACAVFPFVAGREATWDDQLVVARALRRVHETTGVDLPRTDLDEWCIEVLRDRYDHPWISDRRDEVAASVDRLETVIERARATTVPHVVCHNDLMGDNLLVDDDGEVVALLDWDYARSAPREHDLFICFDGPDPAAFLREYGAERVDLTHLEYALLARGVRDLAARVYNEVDRDGIEPWGFARMRRLDADLQLASSFS